MFNAAVPARGSGPLWRYLKLSVLDQDWDSVLGYVDYFVSLRKDLTRRSRYGGAPPRLADTLSARTSARKKLVQPNAIGPGIGPNLSATKADELLPFGFAQRHARPGSGPRVKPAGPLLVRRRRQRPRQAALDPEEGKVDREGRWVKPGNPTMARHAFNRQKEEDEAETCSSVSDNSLEDWAEDLAIMSDSDRQRALEQKALRETSERKAALEREMADQEEEDRKHGISY